MSETLKDIEQEIATYEGLLAKIEKSVEVLSVEERAAIDDEERIRHKESEGSDTLTEELEELLIQDEFPGAIDIIECRIEALKAKL